MTVFWFRRDLRLHDNVGLYHALKEKGDILPIFIFDTDILDKLPKDDARVNFIHDQLVKMNEKLQSEGSGMNVYHGKPLEIYQSIVEEFEVTAVYTNHDYEPYAQERDHDIQAFLRSKNIEFNTFKDQVIFEKNEITKADGKPYVVYTPYSRKWLEAYTTPEDYDSEGILNSCIKRDHFTFLSLEDIGFEPTSIPVPNFILNPKLIQEYEATRNFPALDQTSKLGPHLRFGTVSVRQMVKQAKKEENPTFLKLSLIHI